MDEGLKQELIRYGIVFKGDLQRTKIINDKEYEFYGNTPFVLFARNGQYSFYLLGFDDENPYALTNGIGEKLRLMEFFKISSPILD